MNNAWFYFHCVLALIILVKDHNGTLEESLDNFEKKIGLYTYVDTTEKEVDVPYYIPPTETKVDSSFILPDSLKIKKNGFYLHPKIQLNNQKVTILFNQTLKRTPRPL